MLTFDPVAPGHRIVGKNNGLNRCGGIFGKLRPEYFGKDARQHLLMSVSSVNSSILHLNVSFKII